MIHKKLIIDEILEREWDFFQRANNKGGRAECQNNRDEFIVMRKSQWETLPTEILISYLDDLKEAEKNKINLVVEKYARMMKYSVPEEYKEIEKHLMKSSENKEKLIENIVEIYLEWEIEVINNYPKLSNRGRPLNSKDDNPESVSIETYLKGELYSYSEKTLNLYFEYIKKCAENKENLAKNNIENIVKKKGFSSLEEAENYL